MKWTFLLRSTEQGCLGRWGHVTWGTQMMDGYSRVKVSSARRKSAVAIGMWFVRERKKWPEERWEKAHACSPVRVHTYLGMRHVRPCENLCQQHQLNVPPFLTVKQLFSSVPRIGFPGFKASMSGWGRSFSLSNWRWHLANHASFTVCLRDQCWVNKDILVVSGSYCAD